MGLIGFSFLSSHFLFQRLMLLSLMLSLSACTSIGLKDLFSDYAEQLRDARSAQLKGDFKTANFKLGTEGTDYITTNKQNFIGGNVSL